MVADSKHKKNQKSKIENRKLHISRFLVSVLLLAGCARQQQYEAAVEPLCVTGFGKNRGDEGG